MEIIHDDHRALTPMANILQLYRLRILPRRHLSQYRRLCPRVGKHPNIVQRMNIRRIWLERLYPVCRSLLPRANRRAS
jgi:hypothetical protein